MPDMVRIKVNGNELDVPAGISVASAILRASVNRCRTSVTGTPRGPLCGMGICFECRVSIDGRENCRSCQLAVTSGMQVETT
jgi:sarcosine oxidase subunit alpha